MFAQRSLFPSQDMQVARRWLLSIVIFHRGDFEYGVMRKGACNLDHPNWQQARANATWEALLSEGWIHGPDQLGRYRLTETGMRI